MTTNNAQTGPMTLTEFLLARIAEDERMWQTWSGALPPIPFLADLKGKRRTIAWCAEILAQEWREFEPLPDLASEVLETFALPYADHPDYRQEWKP